MKHFPDESQIIIGITKKFLLSSHISASDFAVKMLAPNIGEREPITDDGAIYSRWANTQARRVNFILNGERLFPLSIKWAWVASLPEAYAQECKKQLLAIVGHTIPLPSLEGAESVDASVPQLMMCSAEVTKNLEPAWDGVYDEKDSLDASNKLIDSLLDSATVSVAEARKVHKGTGAKGEKYDVIKFEL
ncbi:hypothetical protein P7F88_25245 [Vibrio hannami]|uniref:hypothetical protein n=1 Tax=Vibrio hannami TaxID=2717094 RepID=UPI002410747D|nr:hypothetical protein [Vibrio hannami]MDG3089171.1 hypothetical protein [Vibrio hannami]